LPTKSPARPWRCTASGGNIVQLAPGSLLPLDSATGSNPTNDFTTNGMTQAGSPTNSLISSGAIAIDSLTFDTTGASANQTVNVASGGLTLTSGAIVVNSGNANSALLSGGQVGANNSEVIVHQLAASGNAAALTISGQLSSGTGSYLQDGTGTVILGGNNTYTGTTTVNGGTLKVGVATVFSTANAVNGVVPVPTIVSNAFGIGSAVSLAGGTTLDINGFNTNVGSLAGAGNVVITSGKMLTVGGVNYETNFGTMGTSTVLSGQISGGGNLTLTGGEILAVTNASNTLGQVNINNGTLEVSNAGSLGSAFVAVNGVEGIGLPGGELVVQGGAPIGTTTSGIAIANSIVLSGRGPDSNNGIALASIGNNTFSGVISGSGSAASRFTSIIGNATFTNSIQLGSFAGNGLMFGGDGNTIINGQISGGVVGQPGIYKYTPGLLASTAVLNNYENNFVGDVRIDAGTIRVSNGGALGSAVDATAINMNGGILEIRTDAPSSFSTRNVNLATNNTIFVDHATGGSAYDAANGGDINQTVQFGNFTYAASNTAQTFTGRNGYGVNIGGAGGTIALATGNPDTFTNSTNGTLTINAAISSADATSRNFTISGNAETVVTGNLVETVVNTSD